MMICDLFKTRHHQFMTCILVIFLSTSQAALAADKTGVVKSTSQPAISAAARIKCSLQRVTFSTDDDPPVQLVATYCPASADSHGRRAPMAILLHGERADRTSFNPLVPILHAAGMTVLAVDLRGHGESVEPAELKLRQRAEQRDPKLFRAMTHDVEAAYRWLSRRSEADPARFVLVGARVGGSIALEYAARDKSVDGVVIMSPCLAALGLDPTASALKYGKRPLLLLGTPDERANAEAMSRLVPAAVVKIMGDGADATSANPQVSPGKQMLLNASGVEDRIRMFLLEAAGPAPLDCVVASLKGQVFYTPSSREADRLNRDNLRWFSSAAEAQARGYRPPKQKKR